MLDSVKYIAAILVICVHCQPISGLPEVNYFVKNILCRWAVPFFSSVVLILSDEEWTTMGTIYQFI